MKSRTLLIFATLLFLLCPDSLYASELNGKDRVLLSSGSKWEELAGYSRAVVDGDWVFVSGTVGLNPENNAIAADFEQQMDQIFINIGSALKNADAEFEDLVRVRCFIVDTKYLGAMSKKLHQYLGHIKPANTTVVTQLAVEDALIEIEVTALKRRK
jgi:enamine deaminase RidA (YjgF/YER057c/UK114 family)